ncbi:hypothetical protein N657DRAFT_649662 [Parathielavia appendiculata]|uniref:Uncharacterized protein n=1 Tax=Parathielavia appendiculata TaxID=2587402 RepID=A0AAN6TSL6_9PEZI|nr:hypothetical protein N657DRAFT_649662 [Parathielavia appendiculata]
MHRCDDISRRYGADVYIVLRRKGRYYDYSSSRDPSFPLSSAEIERTYPVPVRKTPVDIERRKQRSSETGVTQQVAMDPDSIGG